MVGAVRAEEAPDEGPDYDPELWIEVPLFFPFAGWPDAAAWAHDIAEEAALRPDEREELAERARLLAASDWPATRRFWYFPVQGGFEAIVHVIDVDEVIPPEQVMELLRADDARVTDPVIEAIDGVPGAWRSAYIVSEGDQDQRAAMGVVRAVRMRGEGTTLVELIDADLAAIGVALPDFDALVGDLQFIGGGVVGGRD